LMLVCVLLNDGGQGVNKTMMSQKIFEPCR